MPRLAPEDGAWQARRIRRTGPMVRSEGAARASAFWGATKACPQRLVAGAGPGRGGWAAMRHRNLTARAQGVRGRMYFLEGEPRKQHVGRRKLRVSYVAYGPTYTVFIFPRWA